MGSWGSGIMALFNQHWIKPGRLPMQLGAFYSQLFERRQAGDYKEMVSFDLDDVRKWLDESERFIEVIAQWPHENSGLE